MPLIIHRGSNAFESLIEKMESRYGLDYELEVMSPADDQFSDANIQGHEIIMVDDLDLSYDYKKRMIDRTLEINDEVHIIFIREEEHGGEKKVVIETYRSHSIDLKEIDDNLSHLVGKIYNILKNGGDKENKNILEKKNLFFTSILHFIRDKNQIVQGYLQLLEEEDLEDSEI